MHVREAGFCVRVATTGMTMPRYFFDFREGSDCCVDAQGAEFADVEQAYLEAFEGAQDMWSELLRQRRDPRQWAFEVRNEQRDLLFVLPFMEVIESCEDRKQTRLQARIERQR